MASYDPQQYGWEEPPPRPTTPPVRKSFVLVLAVLGLAAGLVYGIPYFAQQAGYAWESGRAKAAAETLQQLDKAGVVNRASGLFRLATVAVSPAVVNIQTHKLRRAREAPGLPLGGGGGWPGRGPMESFGVGSGVVIDQANGYIVTNNHVVADADQISVRLTQGSEVSAKLVGADPKTDLAVIQIPGPLQAAAEWGDSDKLAIGDWVLAIGSPYMLDHTVTAGIVSATGRNNLALPGMDEGSYQDFIQTDAAINPGNSGGPLVDLNGKVVGINTAILTSSSFLRGDDPSGPSGGFEGIGLAIPASMARQVVEGLIKNGRVVRGFLGVAIQPLNAALAKQFRVPDARGALVSAVQPGSPASRAGLQPGDVIVKVDGRPTPDTATLRNRTAQVAPGTKVAVEYLRDGEPASAEVTLADLAASTAAPAATSYGLRLREMPPGTDGDPLGFLVVEQVVRGGLAARAGLRPGMRVLGVGRAEVRNLAGFERAASAFPPEQGLPLRVLLPGGQSTFVRLGGPRGE